MGEFPPQNSAIAEEQLLHTETPIVVNYPNLRDAYRALQDGTADRDLLIKLGDELEANAELQPDENGNMQVVSLRGSVIRDEHENPVLNENNEEQREKIPKAITSAVFEAAKAARESNDPDAWLKAAKIDEISNLDFSQAKSLVRSLNQHASLEKAYEEAASEKPEETPDEPEVEAEADISDKKAEDKSADKKSEAQRPVDEALKQLKNPESAAKLNEAIEELDGKQREIVVGELSNELSKSLGATSSEGIAKIDASAAAEVLDKYLSKHALLGANSGVQKLRRAAVRNFLNSVAESAPNVLHAIARESESRFVREYRNGEAEQVGAEALREDVAAKAGDVAVRSQLQSSHGTRERYNLAA
ncbi:MAG TPA: hypothetical protein VIM53_04485 [Candidatus Saccharimonadales bacterium]